MADGNGAPQLDLEQILKTLSSLQPLPNSADQSQQQTYDAHSFSTGAINAPQPFPSISTSTPYEQTRSQDPRLNNRSMPQHRQPPSQNRTSTPTIDSSIIIEWKQGIRCVNKIAAQNPAFETNIQKLIKDQERNVRDWENGRQRLIEEQKAKRENEQTQRAAISLPGLLENTPPLRTPEREHEELHQYYNKVYRASRQMAESHAGELKRLGVPFFGVRPDLLLPDSDQSSSPSDDEEVNVGEGVAGKITKKQLLALQRKMVNHLAELYGE